MSEHVPTGRRQFARALLIDLSIMTVVGVILALIGPFGSADAPLAVRLGESYRQRTGQTSRPSERSQTAPDSAVERRVAPAPRHRASGSSFGRP